jgi:uncharacterized protein YjbJ (UPF0337 family)
MGSISLSMEVHRMNKQQVKGTTNEVTGKIKEEAGRLTGDRSTQARGAAQEVKGKVQQGVGNAKESLRDDKVDSDLAREQRRRDSER